MTDLTQTPVDPDVEQRDAEEAPYGYKADGTPKKRPGRPAGSGGGGGGRKKNFDALKEPLAERIVEYLTPPVAFISPLGAAVIDDRADKTAAALCHLAATRPRIAKVIQGMIAGSASVDIVLTGVAILVAIGVDMQRIEPHSMPAAYFHIDEFWQELYGQNGNGQNGAAGVPARRHGLLEEL